MTNDDPPSPARRRPHLLVAAVAAMLVAVLGFGEVAPSVAISSTVPVADETGSTARPAASARATAPSRRRRATRTRLPILWRAVRRRATVHPLRPADAPRRDLRWRNSPLRGPPRAGVPIRPAA